MGRSKTPTTVVNLHYAPDMPLMPDGRPLPDVCTADEVMAYLRLPEPTNKGRPRSLSTLREMKILVGFKLGKQTHYTRKAVLDCLAALEREVV